MGTKYHDIPICQFRFSWSIFPPFMSVTIARTTRTISRWGMRSYFKFRCATDNQRVRSSSLRRPTKFFKLTKNKWDARIVQAVHRYGYSQRDVSDCLDLHYATVSWLANRLRHRERAITRSWRVPINRLHNPKSGARTRVDRATSYNLFDPVADKTASQRCQAAE